MKGSNTSYIFLLLKNLVLFVNVIRLLAITIQYSNSSMHLFYLALSTVLLFDVLDLKHLNILINLEKCRNITCLSMLHKILYNVQLSSSLQTSFQYQYFILHFYISSKVQCPWKNLWITLFHTSFPAALSNFYDIVLSSTIPTLWALLETMFNS